MKVMMIGAHNDDCECNAGGTAALLAAKGCEVLFVNPACIIHNQSLSDETIDAWRKMEINAARLLGADKIIMDDRKARIFDNSCETVEKLEKIILDFRPEMVFIHWPMDNHVEHRMVAKTAYKAISIACVHGAPIKEIYAFEAGISQTTNYFSPHFGIEITSVMDKVEESLRSFSTEAAQGDWLVKTKRVQANYRGLDLITLGRYAEVFRIVKFPDKNNDFAIRELLLDEFRWYGRGMYPAMGTEYFE